MTTSNAANLPAVKFYCTVTYSMVQAMTEEAVRELVRGYLHRAYGDTKLYKTVIANVQAYVRYGVEFLRSGNATQGMACYHYESELLQGGYGELVWAAGCLATLLGSGYEVRKTTREAQAAASGAALYPFGIEATGEARKAYCAVRAFVRPQR